MRRWQSQRRRGLPHVQASRTCIAGAPPPRCSRCSASCAEYKSHSSSSGTGRPAAQALVLLLLVLQLLLPYFSPRGAVMRVCLPARGVHDYAPPDNRHPSREDERIIPVQSRQACVQAHQSGITLVVPRLYVYNRSVVRRPLSQTAAHCLLY